MFHGSFEKKLSVRVEETYRMLKNGTQTFIAQSTYSPGEIFSICAFTFTNLFSIDDSLPITLKFTFPDPMVITVGKPFHLIGGSVVKETFPMRFKIKHKMQRKFLGRWWTLPCVGEKFDETKPFYEQQNLEEKPW